MHARSKSPLLRLSPALLLAALAAALLLAPAAEAKTVFKIPGKGFGHGAGASQWGMFGYAEQGFGHKRILRRYYRKTKIGKAKDKPVRVLLSVRSDGVDFSGARRACGRSLNPKRAYRASLSKSGRKVRLERSNGKKIRSCGRRLSAPSKRRIRIGGDGVYRGRLVAIASSGSLNVVNKVGIDDYVKGVIPNEVPSSWPDAALRAQAVAARSFALTTKVDGDGFNLYDDTRSQVYAGVQTEAGSTNKAARKTSRQVVKHNGKIVQTFFFSTSGGRTENVENVFLGGSPKPYLKSVRDPYDKASPVHRWKVTYSKHKMERLLGGLLQGKLRNIKIKKTGVSPRIVKAKVIGSAGKTTVTGPELRTALGLRSTWATFKKIKK